jgi:hypothetical protein
MIIRMITARDREIRSTWVRLVSNEEEKIEVWVGNHESCDGDRRLGAGGGIGSARDANHSISKRGQPGQHDILLSLPVGPRKFVFF